MRETLSRTLSLLDTTIPAAYTDSYQEDGVAMALLLMNESVHSLPLGQVSRGSLVCGVLPKRQFKINHELDNLKQVKFWK
jgi:hypothetical protein